MSKHIKLKKTRKKNRKPYLTLLKSIEWLEKDWLVYGRIYRSTPEILRFNPIPPLYFSFTVPLIKEIFYKMFSIYWIKLIIYHWELQPGLVWFLLFKLKYIEVTELSYILFMYNFSSAEKKGKKFCLIWSNRDRKTQLARTRIKLLNQRDKNIEI